MLEGIDLPSLSVESKECISCGSTKPLNRFRRDSSVSDGRRMQCEQCEASPRLSTAEHVHRLHELNLNSEAVKKQRWAHQQDFKDEAARYGRQKHHSELLCGLRHLLLPEQLYLMDGRIVGDLAAFKITRQGPEYMMYIPTGVLPEFSIIEFDANDCPVREKRRGWRTVLLRLTKSRLLTEEQVRDEFGEAQGSASTAWRRELFVFRNGHE